MPRCQYPVSRSAPMPGLDNCPVNHFRRRETDKFRSRIQTATQREALRPLRLSDYVLPIDSNGRGTKKPKVVGRPFVANQYFMNLSCDSFSGQDIPEELHCSRV